VAFVWFGESGDREEVRHHALGVDEAESSKQVKRIGSIDGFIRAERHDFDSVPVDAELDSLVARELADREEVADVLLVSTQNALTAWIPELASVEQRHDRTAANACQGSGKGHDVTGDDAVECAPASNHCHLGEDRRTARPAPRGARSYNREGSCGIEFQRVRVGGSRDDDV
jgi:hypothetical protein